LKIKALDINAAAKWIGSILSTKIADGRVYCGTVTGVYEGLNHESETEMIFEVQYDHHLAVLFPKKEEFTLDRMVQDIAHYKEYQRKLNSKHTAIEKVSTVVNINMRIRY
jgi:hypothetical protein